MSSRLLLHIDAFTYNSLMGGGFAEEFINQTLFITQTIPPDTLFLTLYFATILFLAYCMSRIFYILPLVFYIAVWYTSKNSGHGMYFVGLVVYWLFNYIRNTNKAIENEKVEAISYRSPYITHAYQGHTEREKIFGVRGSVLLFVIYILGASLLPPQISQTLFHMLPLVFILIVSDVIPGVGGNSTTGIISIILMILFSVMLTPTVANLFISNLKLIYAVPPVDQATSEPVKELYEVVTQYTFKPIGLAININSLTSLIRGTAGYAWLIWIALDDFLGPTYMQQTASALTTKAKEVPPLLAGVFTSPAVYALIFDIAGSLAMGWYLAIILFIMASAITVPAWYVFGTKVWSGRGASATTTNVNPWTSLVPGDGPLGVRKLITFVVLLLSVGLGTLNVIGSWGVVVTILTGIIIHPFEQLTVIVLGIFTSNLNILIYGFKEQIPISVGIMKTSIAAYTVGSNSGTEKAPPPPAQPNEPP